AVTFPESAHVVKYDIRLHSSNVFFFNDPPPTEIYTLSLHDALPISPIPLGQIDQNKIAKAEFRVEQATLSVQDRLALRRLFGQIDRKSTRLNSSHDQISYAVFCLKKKSTSSLNCITGMRSVMSSSNS